MQYAICPTIWPFGLGPNTTEIKKLVLQDPTRSNLQLVLASLDTYLDKNTKKNPHLYPQVHQEIL